MTAVIVINGHGKILPSTLKLLILDNQMRLTHTSTLRPFRNGKVRYATSFVSPSRDFRIVLAGKTKSRNSFRRLARGIVIPTTTMIYIMSAPDGFGTRSRKSSRYNHHAGNTHVWKARTF